MDKLYVHISNHQPLEIRRPSSWNKILFSISAIMLVLFHIQDIWIYTAHIYNLYKVYMCIFSTSYFNIISNSIRIINCIFPVKSLFLPFESTSAVFSEMKENYGNMWIFYFVKYNLFFRSWYQIIWIFAPNF